MNTTFIGPWITLIGLEELLVHLHEGVHYTIIQETPIIWPGQNYYSC